MKTGDGKEQVVPEEKPGAPVGDATATEAMEGPEAREHMIGVLRSQLQAAARLAEERRERLLYLQAEFDNYRKHFEREREMVIALAEEGLIRELLGTVDDLERLLKSRSDAADNGGLRLVFRNFMKTLEKHGLRRIEALGKRFDPHYHEVLLTEKSDLEEGTILEELQPGYMLKMKVLRPAKVKIAEPCTVIDSNIKTTSGE